MSGRVDWGRGIGGRAARVWGAAFAAVFGVVGVGHRDVEALAFGAFATIAVACTSVRRGLLGRVGLGFLSADTLGWMLPAMVISMREGGEFASMAVPLLLVVLAASILLLVGGLPPVGALALGSIALVGGLVTAGLLAGAESEVRADVKVSMQNVRFEPTQLQGGTAGLRVAVENRDLFWHTFSVDGLGVDVSVPTGATRVVSIVGPPGQYEFVCAIPGHEQAGMTGVIVIGGDES